MRSRDRLLYKSQYGVVGIAVPLPRSAFSGQEPKPVYKDAEHADTVRVHDLLGRMTVEEKVAQLESGWTHARRHWHVGNFSVLKERK